MEKLDVCCASTSADNPPERPAGRGDSTDIDASLEGSIMVPEPSRDTGGLPTTKDPTLDHPTFQPEEEHPLQHLLQLNL